MPPAEHRLVKEVFRAARRASDGEREALLAQADPNVAAEVRNLLALYDEPQQGQDGFLDPTGASDRADEPVPDRIGSFRILRKVGEGGMGCVYEAEQDDPHRSVALKVLRLGFALPKVLARFELEKDVLARLHHPGIAQIYEAGTAEMYGTQQPWFAMELIDGPTLTEHASAADLSTRERLELFARICDAVHHAHLSGVIHRDLKPGNILVTSDGQPKVLDFGIARAADADVQLTTIGTSGGDILGTLPYMSPEQARGDSENLDVRADVYALGVILYELLADRLPYDVASTSLPEAVRVICEREPSRISTIHRSLRGDLETIALKALEKDKERRYASAQALADDVRRHLRSEPIAARPASRLYKLRKFARRRPLVVALFVALAAGTFFSTRFALRSNRFAERELAARRLSDRRAYRMSVLSALRELESGNARAARGLLEAAPVGLRDWEWHHAWQRLDDSLPAFADGRTPQRVKDIRRTGVVRATGQIVVVDAQSTVHLLDRDTGRKTIVQPPGGAPLRPCALSTDGSLVLSSKSLEPAGSKAPKEKVVLWETTTGRECQSFVVEDSFHGDITWSISPTGSHVVLGLERDASVLYETATPRRLKSFAGRFSTFSPDGSWLVVLPSSYRASTSAIFWDVKANREARAPLDVGGKKENTGHAAALSPNRHLLAYWKQQRIAIWDLATDQRIQLLEGSSAHVRVLGFVQGGSLLAAVSIDGLRFWRPRTGELVRTMQPPPHRALLDNDTGRVIGYRVASGEFGYWVRFESDELRIWDPNVSTTPVLEGHTSYVYPVAVSPGMLAASGSWDRTVRLWDAETGKSVAVFEADVVYGLCFDPSGDRLAVVTPHYVEVRSTAAGELLHRRAPSGALAVAFSPDGSRLVVGNYDGVEVRDGDSFELLRTWSGSPCGVVAFAPDATRFATARGNNSNASLTDRSIVVRDAAEGAAAFSLERGSRPHALAFSPDGTLLASSHRDGTVAVWRGDGPSRAPIRTWQAHPEDVFAIAYLSRTRIATGARDGELRIWEADTGELVATLRGHSNYVYSLALSPDGKRLVSGSGDGTVRIWNTQPVSRLRGR